MVVSESRASREAPWCWASFASPGGGVQARAGPPPCLLVWPPCLSPDSFLSLPLCSAGPGASAEHGPRSFALVLSGRPRTGLAGLVSGVSWFSRWRKAGEGRLALEECLVVS